MRPVSFFGLVEVFLVPAEVDLVVVLVVLLLAALDLLVGFAVLVDFTSLVLLVLLDADFFVATNFSFYIILLRPLYNALVFLCENSYGYFRNNSSTLHICVGAKLHTVSLWDCLIGG